MCVFPFETSELERARSANRKPASKMAGKRAHTPPRRRPRLHITSRSFSHSVPLSASRVGSWMPPPCALCGSENAISLSRASTFAVRPRRPSICSPPFCLAQSSNCGIPGLYDRTNASDRRECNGCGAALDEEGKKEGRRARATTTLP